MFFPHPPGNQPGVLPAEIQDDDGLWAGMDGPPLMGCWAEAGISLAFDIYTKGDWYGQEAPFFLKTQDTTQ